MLIQLVWLRENTQSSTYGNRCCRLIDIEDVLSVTAGKRIN